MRPSANETSRGFGGFLLLLFVFEGREVDSEREKDTAVVIFFNLKFFYVPQISFIPETFSGIFI